MSLIDLANQIANIKSDIKSAIINKGVQVSDYDAFTLYASKINAIEGEPINNQDISVTENGEYTADPGYTGLGTVTVNVPGAESVAAERDAIISRTLSGSYTIPNSITRIGSSAFMNCSDLTSVDFSNVETIASDAFHYCSNLTNVYNTANIYEYGPSCFANTNISSINIGSNVTGLFGVFPGCHNLRDIDLSQTNITYMSYCFQNCESLTNALMPNGYYSIDGQCFEGCKSLKRIDLKDVHSMGWQTFINCNSLEYVKINNAIDTMDTSTFDNLGQPIIVQINKTEDSVSGYPWGGSNVTVFWNNSTPYSISVNCTNQDITPDISLTSNGVTIKKDWWMYESGSSVTYNVSYRNYLPQTNTITLNNDETVSVTLLPDPNPTYYQLKTNSITYNSQDISIEQNSFGDDTVLSIDTVYNFETYQVDSTAEIEDLTWDSYADNFGNVTSEDFQNLADEFVLKVKWNYDPTEPQIDSNYHILYESDDNGTNYGIINLNIWKSTSVSNFDVGTINNGIWYPIWHYEIDVPNLKNNYFILSLKYKNNEWIASNNIQARTAWSQNYGGIINLANKILLGDRQGYISDEETVTENISIDWYESGFKKNGEWVYRMIETKNS